jgi:hypothetical protein
MWCGIPANCTSHFIEERLIASYYRNILDSVLLLYLENVTVATAGGMWIDDGAPLHFGRRCMENLNENYQDDRKWCTDVMAISVTELNDLSHFILCGFMNFSVYDNRNCKQRHELVVSVIEAAASPVN